MYYCFITNTLKEPGLIFVIDTTTITTTFLESIYKKNIVEKKMASLPLSDEGINIHDPIASMRTQRAQHILNESLLNGAVLIRAPPLCGKTSMVTLLRHRAEEICASCTTVNLLRYNAEQHSTPEKFIEFWIQCTGFSWEQWLERKERTYVILDETQKIYHLGSSHPFWQRVKEHMNAANRHTVGLIMFAAYGEAPSLSSSSSSSSYVSASTPVKFSSAMGQDELALTKEEFKEIVTKFNKHFGYLTPVSEPVASYLYSWTGGHVGLTRRALTMMHESLKCTVITRVSNDKEIMGYFHSERFLQHIRDTRAVPNVELTQEQRDVLLHLIWSKNDVLTGLTGPIENDAITLTQNGYLARTRDGFAFASPLVRQILLQRILQPGDEKEVNIFGPVTLTDLLMRILRNFRRDILCHTLSLTKESHPIERQFQMEFYRAAVRCLGPQCTCFPDVGRVFNTTGQLDFYINGDYQWGVEILRCGNRKDEHIRRFTQGLYQQIPMKDWAILDFHPWDQNKRRQPRPNQAQYWVILCTSDFKKLCVRRLINGKVENADIELMPR
jgi:hypothetical protein